MPKGLSASLKRTSVPRTSGTLILNPRQIPNFKTYRSLRDIQDIQLYCEITNLAQSVAGEVTRTLVDSGRLCNEAVDQSLQVCWNIVDVHLDAKHPDSRMYCSASMRYS